jgi:hypothetical protein
MTEVQTEVKTEVKKTTSKRFIMLKNGVSIQCNKLPEIRFTSKFTEPFAGTLIFPKHQIYKRSIQLNTDEIIFMA